MRLKGQEEERGYWFFTTKIGKDTYMTLYVEGPASRSVDFSDFREEGAFKKWNEKEDREYFICRYVLDGDKLTVDAGSVVVMDKLTKAEKIGVEPHHPFTYFKTPPGWLAKYLKENGPKTLYDGTMKWEFRRPKK
jgi:hypothetical protein